MLALGTLGNPTIAFDLLLVIALVAYLVVLARRSRRAGGK